MNRLIRMHWPVSQPPQAKSRCPSQHHQQNRDDRRFHGLLAVYFYLDVVAVVVLIVGLTV